MELGNALLPSASCKQTQHCWPTTPNIVGCYMCVCLQTLLQVVASCCVLLGVVAQFETGQTLQLQILLSCCVRLRVALPFFTYSNIPANFWQHGFSMTTWNARIWFFSFFLSAYKLNLWLVYKGNKNHAVKISPNIAQRTLTLGT